MGRPDSIALRIPDSTITCHLIDQCGPVTVTSANPTGEGDTTHHLQVLAKLGVENVGELHWIIIFSVVFSCDIWNVLIYQIYIPSVMVFCAMGRLEITPFLLWWIAAKLTVERFRSSELASPLTQQFWKYSTHCWKNTRKTNRKVQRIPGTMPQLITSTMRLKARMKMRESSEWKKDIFLDKF